MFHRHPLRPETINTSSLGNSFDVEDPEDDLDQRLKDIKAIKMKVRSSRGVLWLLYNTQEVYVVHWNLFVSFLGCQEPWQDSRWAENKPQRQETEPDHRLFLRCTWWGSTRGKSQKMQSGCRFWGKTKSRVSHPGTKGWTFLLIVLGWKQTWGDGGLKLFFFEDT